MRIEPGERVCDTRGREGTLLRYETYPGTGDKKWATVKFDETFSARRVEPKELRSERHDW